MGVLCSLGRHRAAPHAIMLTGQALTRCVRCAAPLVSGGGPWRAIRGDRRDQLRVIVQLVLQEDVSGGSLWRS
jgi:hypothetical protein